MISFTTPVILKIYRPELLSCAVIVSLELSEKKHLIVIFTGHNRKCITSLQNRVFSSCGYPQVSHTSFTITYVFTGPPLAFPFGPNWTEHRWEGSSVFVCWCVPPSFFVTLTTEAELRGRQSKEHISDHGWQSRELSSSHSDRR